MLLQTTLVLTAVEQSVPAQPSTHWHELSAPCLPFRHFPRPEHEFGHWSAPDLPFPLAAQVAPKCPGEQSQPTARPDLTQRPLPEQARFLMLLPSISLSLHELANIFLSASRFWAVTALGWGVGGGVGVVCGGGG